jgi:ATP-dependent HslUV protease subunit HslV
MSTQQIHATTIIGLRHNGKVAIGGDGQVTVGATVMKQQSNKIRKLYKDSVLVGFAGSAADAFSHALIISGTGDVIEPDDGIVAVGSGGSFALAAARMLVKHTKLDAKAIVRESLDVASDICIYTNKNFHIEEL